MTVGAEVVIMTSFSKQTPQHLDNRPLSGQLFTTLVMFFLKELQLLLLEQQRGEDDDRMKEGWEKS